jgi:hypothetical protein
MGVTQRLKDDAFRRPRGSRFFWVTLGWGILLVALGVAGSLLDGSQGLFSVEPGFVVIGVAFALMSGAELLPIERRQLAGVLRVGSWAAWILLGAVWTVPTFLRVDKGGRIIMLVLIGFLLAMIWTLRTDRLD